MRLDTVQVTVLLVAVLCAWAALIAVARPLPLVSNQWNCGALILGFAIVATCSAATAQVVVSDRQFYVRLFEGMSVSSLQTAFQRADSMDSLYLLLTWGLARVAAPTEVVLYGSLAAAAAVAHVIAFRILLPPWATLMAWVTLLGSGLFSAYSEVAVRQGLALACLAPAVAIFATADRQTAPVAKILALVVGAGSLHWSAIVFGAALLSLTLFGVSIRLLLVAWGSAAVGFVLGLQERVLAPLTDRFLYLDVYTTENAFRNYGAGGNRWDFLLVSLLVLALGLAGLRLSGRDEAYGRVLKAYILFNAVFLTFGYVAFADRIVVYSWFLFPVIFWFPLASRDGGVAALARTGGGLAVAVLAFLRLAS